MTVEENKQQEEQCEQPTEEHVADQVEETFEGDAAALAAELEAVRAELANMKEHSLRALAEAQNIKRRSEIDVENARKYGAEKIISELLPVVDNLERALQSADADIDGIKPILEGVELTLKGFVDALNKSNVEIVDPHGEPFNPELHQAMTMIENPDVEPNSVVAVMQKGYRLNGRLLRPAMVVVAK
ncbi:MAG TPA: nucleotide exchange factor GrpE [Pseudomonadales bacterium]|nr:nucleotide exchange factor GrpE [Pseudomonadales bacterium]